MRQKSETEYQKIPLKWKAVGQDLGKIVV